MAGMYDDDNDLTPEDVFDEEIDQGELADIAKSMVVPEGKYFPETPFPFKKKTVDFTVVGEDGETQEKSVPVVGFWGVVHNEEGQEYRLGIDIGLSPVYVIGTKKAGNQVFYDFPAAGAKPYYVTKNFHQGVKLYKKVYRETPKKFGDLIEFLRMTPLRLTNRVIEGRTEDEDPSSFVVGFNLADA